VRTLIGTHGIERGAPAGHWRVTEQYSAVPLPDTIEGIILSRIDRLEDEVKQVLKAAAVIGRSFFYRVLKAVTDLDAALDDDLSKLRRAELIDEKQLAPELEYVFKHPLIQQATYDSILEDRRRGLHRRVGRCIEDLFAGRLEPFFSVLAYHYSQAEEWEKAQQYMFKAGDQTGSIAADAEALEQYRLALDAAGRGGAKPMDVLARADLDRKMGQALYRLGKTELALDFLYSGLARLGIDLSTPDAAMGRAIALKVLKRLWQKVLRPPSGDTKESPPDVDRLRFDFILLIGNIEAVRNPKRFLLCILAGIPVAEKYSRSREYAINHSARGRPLHCGNGRSVWESGLALAIRWREPTLNWADGAATASIWNALSCSWPEPASDLISKQPSDCCSN
jgi:hypothetical protein